MNAANEMVWISLRRTAREGGSALRLPPHLLVGPPGIGKSFWARRVGALIGLPTEVLESTSEPAGFGVVGMQRGWSTGQPGRLVRRILSQRIANPLIAIDEIEKFGSVRSSRGSSYDLGGALLPLLEQSSAAAWSCPYYQIEKDMSHVSLILTANSTRGISEPLLSRCPPVLLSKVSREHLENFVVREAERRNLPDVMAEAILEALRRVDGVEPSLRSVGRMLDRAEAIGQRPLLH